MRVDHIFRKKWCRIPRLYCPTTTTTGLTECLQITISFRRRWWFSHFHRSLRWFPSHVNWIPSPSERVRCRKMCGNVFHSYTFSRWCDRTLFCCSFVKTNFHARWTLCFFNNIRTNLYQMCALSLEWHTHVDEEVKLTAIWSSTREALRRGLTFCHNFHHGHVRSLRYLRKARWTTVRAMRCSCKRLKVLRLR